MKKIVILLYSVFLLFACSDENNLQTEKNNNVESSGVLSSRPLPPVETSIDSMFYEYVTSSIFIEVEGLLKDFNQDLNYDEESDESIGETEAELFNWIATNLSQTNFSSVAEAESRWNHIKNRNFGKRTEFAPVFEFIANAPLEEVTLVLHKWLIEPVTNGDGGDYCDEKFDYCTSKAAADYALRSRSMEEFGVTVEKQAMSDNRLERDTEKCRDTYKKCIGAT